MASKKYKYDVITIGSATRDIMFESEAHRVVEMNKPYKHIEISYEYGAKMPVNDVAMTTGGGACNTAVSFARLGYNVAAISIIGKDINGQAVIENLKNEKVDTKFVQVSKKSYTGFATIITVDVKGEREHLIFHHQGSTKELDVDMSVLQKASPKIIYTCSLRSEKWKKILNNVKKYCSDNNILWAWNPGGKQLKEGLKGLNKYLNSVDLLFLNRKEALELMHGGKIKKDIKIEKLLEEIFNVGPEVVVVTDGRNGAYAYDGEKFMHVPMYKKVKTIDTTGVGDAFGSTFTYAYNEFNGDIGKALKAAAVNAAYVSGKVGAQHGALGRAELNRILKKG